MVWPSEVSLGYRNHAVLSELLQWKRMSHHWGECEMPHIVRTEPSMLSLTSGCYRFYQVWPTEAIVFLKLGDV